MTLLMDLFQLASYFCFLLFMHTWWSGAILLGFFAEMVKKLQPAVFPESTLGLSGSEFFCLIYYYFVASPLLHHHSVFVVGISVSCTSCTPFQF